MEKYEWQRVTAENTHFNCLELWVNGFGHHLVYRLNEHLADRSDLRVYPYQIDEVENAETTDLRVPGPLLWAWLDLAHHHDRFVAAVELWWNLPDELKPMVDDLVETPPWHEFDNYLHLWTREDLYPGDFPPYVTLEESLQVVARLGPQSLRERWEAARRQRKIRVIDDDLPPLYWDMAAWALCEGPLDHALDGVEGLPARDRLPCPPRTLDDIDAWGRWFGQELDAIVEDDGGSLGAVAMICEYEELIAQARTDCEGSVKERIEERCARQAKYLAEMTWRSDPVADAILAGVDPADALADRHDEE